MAHAMIRAPESPFAQHLPDHPLAESNGGYQFIYSNRADALELLAFRGSDRAAGVIEWVLGAGAQGETPLVKTRNGVVESRVSFFPQLQQYGITVGQNGGASPNAIAALGLKESRTNLKECIGCHATSMTADFDRSIPGVQCERCHPGAQEHANGHGTPLNPGKLTPIAQVQFCGQCHRVKPPVDDLQLENMRFQPLRLMKSRCYASGKLACPTCHAAHQDAKRNAAAYYNEKCQICHSNPAAHVDARANGDCIGCHMPYVQLHPALKFTDHYIRVVKPGDLPAEILARRATGSTN
jgi:hypothetical protein